MSIQTAERTRGVKKDKNAFDGLITKQAQHALKF